MNPQVQKLEALLSRIQQNRSAVAGATSVDVASAPAFPEEMGFAPAVDMDSAIESGAPDTIPPMASEPPMVAEPSRPPAPRPDSFFPTVDEATAGDAFAPEFDSTMQAPHPLRVSRQPMAEAPEEVVASPTVSEPPMDLDDDAFIEDAADLTPEPWPISEPAPAPAAAVREVSPFPDIDDVPPGAPRGEPLALMAPLSPSGPIAVVSGASSVDTQPLTFGALIDRALGLRARR